MYWCPTSNYPQVCLIKYNPPESPALISLRANLEGSLSAWSELLYLLCISLISQVRSPSAAKLRIPHDAQKHVWSFQLRRPLCARLQIGENSLAAELVAHQALLLAELFAQRLWSAYLPLLLPHQERGIVWAKSAVIITMRELSLRWWRVLCVGGCVLVFICVYLWKRKGEC